MHIVFDSELIGTEKPVFLVCTKEIETGKRRVFWGHKQKDLEALSKYLKEGHTWIGFNSETFDRPIIAAALDGFDYKDIKAMASEIIEENQRSFVTYRKNKISFREYDHIDIIDVAPGVMISLKTYAGRMNFPSMIDMPFEHTKDLEESEYPLLVKYCQNDVDVTEALYKTLHVEMELRRQLSAEHGIDLRSKSDAQIAEAILRKKCGIGGGEKMIPSSVDYKVPPFIKTTNPKIQNLIDTLDGLLFQLNAKTGQPEVPLILQEPFALNEGTYQLGIGGIHSTHDTCMYLEASDNLILSDFDVASYYPNIMMKAGLIPNLGGDKGKKFLDEYKHIYDQRMEAKRSGNKKVANSLKITLNGTFGKLGSMYCSFYSPDLLLATTITGQLNLLCLIHDLERVRGVRVRSANTDGVLVAYPPKAREQVLKVIAQNAKRTGFEYEETQYLAYAAKDVNNYFAVKKKFDKETGEWRHEPDGVKRKGIYATSGVHEMKNPTMQVCSDAVAAWLECEYPISVYIEECPDFRKFVEIRNVKGGGVQHERFEMVDDWEEIAPRQWAYPGQTTKPVKRKSRPPPRQVGVGGVPFGRVARWYMTTKQMPPLSYVASGNKVPGTDGARVCLTLKDSIPKDIDYEWYITEAQRILRDVGVPLE